MKRILFTLGIALALGATLVTSTSDPQPAAAQTPAVATFRGSFNGWNPPQVLGPVHLRAGLLVLHARHGGTANVAVVVVLPEPGKSPEDSCCSNYHMINAIGRYDGATAEILAEEGDYYLLLSASGAYELILEQPLPGTVTPVAQRMFTGQYQQVTPVIELPAGPVRISATSPGDGGFALWMYRLDDLGGAAVANTYDGRLIDVYGSYDDTITVDLPRAGLYFFRVSAAPEDARWTVRIE
jgi:hypothetical protein